MKRSLMKKRKISHKPQLSEKKIRNLNALCCSWPVGNINEQHVIEDRIENQFSFFFILPNLYPKDIPA